MGNSKSLSAKFVETVRGCDFLICSDASGPIGSQGVLQLALSGRLPSPRLFDICSDQIRALRSRMLIRAIIDKSIKAVLLKMGNSVRDIDIKTDQNRRRCTIGSRPTRTSGRRSRIPRTSGHCRRRRWTAWLATNTSWRTRRSWPAPPNTSRTR